MFTNDKKRPIMGINGLSHKVYFIRHFSFCSIIYQFFDENFKRTDTL